MMSCSTAFRRLHCALTIMLIVIVIAGGFIFYSENAKPDEKLISERQLTPDVWLYVSKVEGGATVAEVYRYFLNKKSDNPSKLIRDSEPFMITDQRNAKVSTVGDRVLISVTGTIYRFANAGFFYDGNKPVAVLIDLNATATRRYGS